MRRLSFDSCHQSRKMAGEMTGQGTGQRAREKTGRRARVNGFGCEGGYAVVEFAIVLPVLFLLLMGVVFVAQGFNLQMELHGAAYEGARAWASDPPGGDGNHCTPPACDPKKKTAFNFDRYVVPIVKQHLTSSGYDGEAVKFFAVDPKKYNDEYNKAVNNVSYVKVTLYYPITLPLGGLGSKLGTAYVNASYVMKRGG